MNDPNNYWASSPTPHPVEFPVTLFHATEAPRRVNSPDEEMALGEEWSRNYADKKRDWPKMYFKAKTAPKADELHYDVAVAASPEEATELGAGWSETVPPPPPPPPLARLAL